MSKFFFTQIQNIEIIVEGGKPSGGVEVATHVWTQSLHALGHEIYLSRNEEDDRQILPEHRWIKTFKIHYSSNGVPVLRRFFYRIPKLGVIRKA